MATVIASGETGTSDSVDTGKRTASLLFVEFVAAGDVDVEATPDGGSTWLQLTNVTSSGVKTLSPSPETIRVMANNGAEVNVWVE